MARVLYSLLAFNTHTANQAMAVGPYLRGVQFHPEATAAAMRRMMAVRAPHRNAPLLATAGGRILRNFVEHFG